MDWYVVYLCIIYTFKFVEKIGSEAVGKLREQIQEEIENMREEQEQVKTKISKLHENQEQVKEEVTSLGENLNTFVSNLEEELSKYTMYMCV